MSEQRLLALVDDLRKASAETACVEFKENIADPTVIGKYISALSNAAALSGQGFGYLIWGIRDGDHTVVGTGFDPVTAKHKSQPLEFWLSNSLTPDIPFAFKPIAHPDGRLVLLEIPAATSSPVEFDRTAYIRIGSATPRLSDHPERQKALWTKLQPNLWEAGIAAQFVTADDVLSRIDYVSYFDLTRQPLPDNRAGIFERLAQDSIIAADVGDRWNITNLGAILFAKQLDQFDQRIARKAVRFTAYDGKGRDAPVTHRQDGKRGYASGFEGLVSYIDGLLPVNEEIGHAFRTDHPLFPVIAIRELIANALIHQDMTVTGAGPSIALFDDRMEITNPGAPLISTDRFIDAPPRSRNEALAALMRRMRLCEEEGSGIDKVVGAVELYQLPPPDFRTESSPGSTRVILFAPRRFANMTVDERIRACYQHAVLRWVQGEVMRNATLRERFGIETQNSSQVSAVIRSALTRNLIRPADPDRPKAGYVPAWA